MPEGPVVKVGMAGMAASASGATLACFGLGSCVALVLWDAEARVGGLAHVMLPDSGVQLRRQDEGEPARYADTALPALLLAVEALGARRLALTARLVGGATMFQFAGQKRQGPGIGERNCAALEAGLAAHGIRLAACDTGGTVGRSLEFFTNNGTLLVRTAQQGSRLI